MARKNKLEGAIPGAGRPKENTGKVTLSVMVTPEAKSIIESLPRMERGDFVSKAILAYKNNET